MLAEADAYAAKNPNNYRGIIDRYSQVTEHANGTRWEDDAFQKLRIAVQNHQRVSRQMLSQYTQQMQTLVKAGKNQEAFNIWIDFPAQLWTPEIDQLIEDAISQNLPQGFSPQPPNGAPGQRPPPPRNN